MITDEQLREKEDHNLVVVFARTPGVYNQSGNYQSTSPSEYESDDAGQVTDERRSDNYWLVNFNTERYDL
ncbi:MULTISPECIES: hypothetical protein [Pseudomonas]|uniref:hypothetical protein n=1 Tax=Pseudomonas TaxID=286 RepID=UPI000B33BBF4